MTTCRPAEAVHPKAIATMQELAYDLRQHFLKRLADLPDVEYDVAVVMCDDGSSTLQDKALGPPPASPSAAYPAAGRSPQNRGAAKPSPRPAQRTHFRRFVSICAGVARWIK